MKTKKVLRVEVVRASNWKYKELWTISTNELWSLLQSLEKRFGCDVIADVKRESAECDIELQIYDDYVE